MGIQVQGSGKDRQDRLVKRVPFEGLSPARGLDHARWIVAAMGGREGVALVVPEGFEAYARLLHPLHDGQRWSEVAPAYLAEGVEPHPYPFPMPVQHVEGDMGAELVDALAPVLAAATSTPKSCHVGLWNGWGELHAGSHTSVLYRRLPWWAPLGRIRVRRERRRDEDAERRREQPLSAFVVSCAVQPWWGGRDMLLFDGPLQRVADIGTLPIFAERLRRRGPQWWWPEDRQWFVATEIDYPWSYVGGKASLIDALIGDANVEAVRVDPSLRW